MRLSNAMIIVWVLTATTTLAGCGSSEFGADGSIHPDHTAAIANYTGQGRGGTGWAGNSSGEFGPSEIPPTPDDFKPR